MIHILIEKGENPLAVTDTTQSDETIRKIWAKDLKIGEAIHTVFRATFKEKITSRAGKSFLKLTLVDRTGSIDARIFENVSAADGAFSTDDYLLVKGKVDQFKGHAQLVIDRLERLDPGPIDASEFAYAPPAAPPPAPVREERKEEHVQAKVRLSKRLERLLEHPALAQALDNFVGQLEKVLAAHPPPPRPEKKPREERAPRGPKVEVKPKTEKHDEPKRDASLPEGLAFKPFNALVPAAPAAEDKPAAPTGNDSSGS